MSLVETENLTKIYGQGETAVVALDHVSLSVSAGEFVMVMGLGAGGFPVSYVFPHVGLVAAVAIGLIFGVLAALVPARQAARMNIVRALRYE